MTDAHGLSAEEMEHLVTLYIETTVNGVIDPRPFSFIAGIFFCMG
jgi:hypothetical protein